MTFEEYRQLGLPMDWLALDHESRQQYLDQADPKMRPFYDEKNWMWPLYFLNDPENDPARGQVLLDLRAPDDVPDGYYTVIHHAIIDVRPRNIKNTRYANSTGRSTTRRALVEDRHFIVVPTVMAAFQAVCRSLGVNPRRPRCLSGPFIPNACIKSFTRLPGRKTLEVSF